MRRFLMIGAALLALGAGCAQSAPLVPAAPTPIEQAPVPPISIEEPLANSLAVSPFPAWGKGIAFENTI
ncbi:MAG: hypothetical protein Q7S02_03735, partial [bacterium]|nr:hypothetical protein [bacterium]